MGILHNEKTNNWVTRTQGKDLILNSALGDNVHNWVGTPIFVPTLISKKYS